MRSEIHCLAVKVKIHTDAEQRDPFAVTGLCTYSLWSALEGYGFTREGVLRQIFEYFIISWPLII
jgi:hypothetical protein